MTRRGVRWFLILCGSSPVWAPIVLYHTGHIPPVHFPILGVDIVIEPLDLRQLVYGILFVGAAIFLTRDKQNEQEAG